MTTFASVTPSLLVQDIDRSTAFYGMREFAVEDPDGHLLTFAERVSE